MTVLAKALFNYKKCFFFFFYFIIHSHWLLKKFKEIFPREILTKIFLFICRKNSSKLPVNITHDEWEKYSRRFNKLSFHIKIPSITQYNNKCDTIWYVNISEQNTKEMKTKKQKTIHQVHALRDEGNKKVF